MNEWTEQALDSEQFRFSQIAMASQSDSIFANAH